MPLTQPKTDLAYLRSEKAKAEQKLRACQHREKILESRTTPDWSSSTQSKHISVPTWT